LAEQTNENIKVLLQKIEQQVSSGHTMAPAGDCAVDTWAHVLQAIPTTDSPYVRGVLTDFVTEARSRAAEAMRTGNMIGAGDLSVFADQANGLLARSSEAARPGGAERPPGEAALKFEPLAASLPPLPPSDAAPTRPSPNTSGRIPGGQTAGAAFALPQTAVRASVAEFYTARGDQLLAARDISAARTFYEYAVNAGSARAATTLARTYDADFVARLGVVSEARPYNQDHWREHRAHVWRTRTRGPIPPAATDAVTIVP
jgi:hypothetical protein